MEDSKNNSGHVAGGTESANTSAHTATPISLVDGHYPCFKEIKGLSFDISIVMYATDLTFAEQMQRHAEAERIVTSWNAHDDLVKALEGVIRVADRATDEFDAARAALAKATK